MLRTASLLTVERYEICPVCGWEDDAAIRHSGDVHEHSGPNHTTLALARERLARGERAKGRG